MLPVLITNNVMNGGRGNAVFFSQLSGRHTARHVFSTNIYYILLCKFGVRGLRAGRQKLRFLSGIMIAAARNFPFFSGVAPIICGRSNKQVIRIHALRIIAFVAHAFIGWINFVMKKVGDSMRASIFSHVVKHAIASAEKRSFPLPTFIAGKFFKAIVEAIKCLRRKFGQDTIVVGHSLDSLNCDLGLVRRWRVVSSRFLF
jgi:hypothetical protein